MKEITRIHIAKVAYDIELSAKKELENYIAALERYAGDKELLADIEIRITELLGERGVQSDGVITSDDVAAIRAQLGEPSDFAPEGEEVAREASDEPRRVYRDEEGAVLGGVLAGFGRFFGIDPLWLRLIFILLLFASFGTALLVYLILWLIIPPARTAAEKLRMSGKPVTLASIKDLAGTDEQIGNAGRIVRHILRIAVGIALLLVALGGIIAVATGTITLKGTAGPVFVSGVDDVYTMQGIDAWVRNTWWFTTMVGLFAVSGLLFAALCSVLAYAVFRRYWTKRIGNAVIAIIASGLIIFSSGVGVGIYGYISERSHADARYESVTKDTPQGFQNIKHLTVLGRGRGNKVSVNYIVSDKPRFEVNGVAGPELTITMNKDGVSATAYTDVNLHDTWDNPSAISDWEAYTSLGSRKPSIQVYGPALDSIEFQSNLPTTSYTNNTKQERLSVIMSFAKEFRLLGSYSTVDIKTRLSLSNALLDDASIDTLNVDGIENAGNISAGDIKTLNLTQTDACMLRNELGLQADRSIQLRSISSGKITSNGEEYPVDLVESRQIGCISLSIEHPYKSQTRTGVIYEDN